MAQVEFMGSLPGFTGEKDGQQIIKPPRDCYEVRYAGSLYYCEVGATGQVWIMDSVDTDEDARAITEALLEFHHDRTKS
ncbi:hypothetical protein vBSlqSZDD2_37 [Serratia phage vB_SlqS_ZDD2]|nr:hypothetical protein vBSlqSZDD2_37 [Serratia phage vB_SlqS_ZDD2]